MVSSAQLAFIPQQIVPNPTILVATWNHGLFALTANATAHEITNQPVTGLAPDGRGSALAITGAHSLHRRSPTGHWTTLAESEFPLSCCLAVQNTIYVGTDTARLLRLSPEDHTLHPITSFDHITGRDTWFAGSAIVNGQHLGPPLGIRSLAANAEGTILFANVHVGGIPRSTDGGQTWHPTIDINADVHEVRAHPAHPNLIAAASAIGLCISRDAGATWNIEREGLQATHCSAVAFSADDILVSASTDPFAPQGRVYRHSANAIKRAFQDSTAGIVDTGCIATGGPFIAIIDKGGSLYRSSDFGHTWSHTITGLPAPSGVLIL
jgi:hypothetical protein